ncbi:ATPase inhibitor subunit zeta [Bradyrhizobium guangxiense]|uniref:ATPase inhibitor subunit zeta n=1 Tax=Bradyrhizobium guangxiense TaxID=1325115 RepID=UPI0010089926|nr:ATPase inhibitor subunit zeta [Bradyrhizobium guangxiense]
MTSFDKHKSAFETEFIAGEDLKFRARSRAVALLAQWAAYRLSQSAEATKALTQEILEADVANPAVEQTVDLVAAVLAPAGVLRQEVRQALDRFRTEAEADERVGRPRRGLVRGKFTLPDLENRLATLQNGALVRIDRVDYERLFGLNDAARGRLRNFARSHRCVASFADSAVLFRKQIAPVGECPEA